MSVLSVLTLKTLPASTLYFLVRSKLQGAIPDHLCHLSISARLSEKVIPCQVKQSISVVYWDPAEGYQEYVVVYVAYLLTPKTTQLFNIISSISFPKSAFPLPSGTCNVGLARSAKQG